MPSKDPTNNSVRFTGRVSNRAHKVLICVHSLVINIPSVHLIKSPTFNRNRTSSQRKLNTKQKENNNNPSILNVLWRRSLTPDRPSAASYYTPLIIYFFDFICVTTQFKPSKPKDVCSPVTVSTDINIISSGSSGWKLSSSPGWLSFFNFLLDFIL